MKENRRAAVTCGLMTLMLFAALAVYMRARLEYAGTWGQTLSLAALFALVAGGAMALVARLQKPERGALLLSCTVIALTMLARVSMLDYQTAGHAQAQMVTDQYSHILDENRRANAQLVEKAFYGGQGAESVESEQGADTQVADQAQAAGMDIQQLMKILSNPEMVNMLKMLSKTMG